MKIIYPTVLGGFLLSIAGCGDDKPTVTSGAGHAPCERCTAVINDNNSSFPLFLESSGRKGNVGLNSRLTFNYDQEFYGETVFIFAQRINPAGSVFPPSISEDFFLNGGQELWTIEDEDFE